MTLGYLLWKSQALKEASTMFVPCHADNKLILWNYKQAFCYKICFGNGVSSQQTRDPVGRQRGSQGFPIPHPVESALCLANHCAFYLVQKSTSEMVCTTKYEVTCSFQISKDWKQFQMAFHREAAKPVYYWCIHPVEDYVAVKNGREFSLEWYRRISGLC